MQFLGVWLVFGCTGRFACFVPLKPARCSALLPAHSPDIPLETPCTRLCPGVHPLPSICRAATSLKHLGSSHLSQAFAEQPTRVRTRVGCNSWGPRGVGAVHLSSHPPLLLLSGSLGTLCCAALAASTAAAAPAHCAILPAARQAGKQVTALPPRSSHHSPVLALPPRMAARDSGPVCPCAAKPHARTLPGSLLSSVPCCSSLAGAASAKMAAALPEHPAHLPA